MRQLNKQRCWSAFWVVVQLWFALFWNVNYHLNPRASALWFTIIGWFGVALLVEGIVKREWRAWHKRYWEINSRCPVAGEKTQGRYYCTRGLGHDGPCAAKINYYDGLDSWFPMGRQRRFENDPAGRTPTHQCKSCGAFWIYYPEKLAGMQNGSWSLVSASCGSCCDNVPMKENQLKELVPSRFDEFGNSIKPSDDAQLIVSGEPMIKDNNDEAPGGWVDQRFMPTTTPQTIFERDAAPGGWAHPDTVGAAALTVDSSELFHSGPAPSESSWTQPDIGSDVNSGSSWDSGSSSGCDTGSSSSDSGSSCGDGS